MKKTGLLNGHVSRVISEMGHTDKLAIGDSGLPIPKETERIDIALIKNVPRFIDTLKIVLSELCIERVFLSKDIVDVSPVLFEEIKKVIGDVEITLLPHDEFKADLKNCKAVIRTGEQTYFANIILQAGVIF